MPQSCQICFHDIFMYLCLFYACTCFSSLCNKNAHVQFCLFNVCVCMCYKSNKCASVSFIPCTQLNKATQDDIKCKCLSKQN